LSAAPIRYYHRAASARLGPWRLPEQRMRKGTWLTLAAIALPLGSCLSVGALNEDRLPDGPLSKAEIERCLATPHKVGANMILPVPRPGYVFKPGYNFSVKEPDGSYGFGYQQAANGRVTIRYPAQRKVSDFEVKRRNGVVYFGDDPTTCR
jgi:hypothetical protein